MGITASASIQTSLSTGEDIAKYVNDNIKQHKATVFSKSYCPYCKQAKQLLFRLRDEINSEDVDVHVIELNQMTGPSDGPSVQHYLLEQTGQRTVPNIFVGGKHVGGNDDVQDLHQSGKLKAMLIATTKSDEL